jgi:hypothetical protein
MVIELRTYALIGKPRFIEVPVDQGGDPESTVEGVSM